MYNLGVNNMEFRILEKCENLFCTNKAGEGAFTIMSIGGVVLYLCLPCAEEVSKGTNRKQGFEDQLNNAHENLKCVPLYLRRPKNLR
jgi:hypothetical protein